VDVWQELEEPTPTIKKSDMRLILGLAIQSKLPLKPSNCMSILNGTFRKRPDLIKFLNWKWIPQLVTHLFDDYRKKWFKVLMTDASHLFPDIKWGILKPNATPALFLADGGAQVQVHLERL